jgi:hypothetical protein
LRYFDRAIELLPPASPERKSVQELRDKARNSLQKISGSMIGSCIAEGA